MIVGEKSRLLAILYLTGGQVAIRIRLDLDPVVLGVAGQNELVELPLLCLSLEPHGAGVVRYNTELAGLILPETEVCGDDVREGVSVLVRVGHFDGLGIRRLRIILHDDGCGRRVCGSVAIVILLGGLQVDDLSLVLRLVDFLLRRLGSDGFFLLFLFVARNEDACDCKHNKDFFHTNKVLSNKIK